MKKFALYVVAVVALAALMILSVFLLIVATPRGVFASSYQSVIQRKYDKLLRTDEPKIILVGGSNLAFGLDEARLEEATGYKVVNLGLHVSFGHRFNAELAKENINEGDIVLLAYEYTWMTSDQIDYVGLDLVMSGIDHRLELYRHIPIDKYPEVLGNLFSYAKLKRTFTKMEGDYSSFSFDEEGRMILDRPAVGDIQNYESKKDWFGVVTVAGDIAEDSISYVSNLKSYVEKQGASIYFIAPPALKDAVVCTDSDFQSYQNQIVSRAGIPYISDPLAYLFPMEYMYDTVYHCNNIGQQHRTELLIQDLAAVGIGAGKNGA